MRVMDMNFTQLKYFHTVCTFRSVSAAADYLHVSQPTISAAIKELENEFGLSLLLRHHKGVTPTPEGETLCKLGADILERAAYTEQIMKDLGSGRKTLKLGVPPMIGTMVLGDIYNDFRIKNPDVSIEISEGGYEDLMHKLNDDYLDLVFLPHDDLFTHDLSAVSLTKLEIVCCVHKDNPIARHKTIRPASLQNTPVVLFENSFFQTTKIKKWFHDGGVSPDILLQTEQLSTVYNMVSNNLAVGFMFRHVMDAYPDIVTVPLKSPIHIQVSLVRKKSAHSFSGMERFIRYMKSSRLVSGDTE